MAPDVNEAAFWRDRYRQGGDGWELGEPTPPLVDRLAAAPPEPAGGRVAVVGCGRGHDARAFAGAGYEVWGFDFAEEAVVAARELAVGDGVAVHFEERDVFTLADAYLAHFDVVWEYTCFCAIDPARRDEYLDVLRGTLRPDGTLIALFYPVREGPAEGPPYPATEEEIRRRLEGRFRIDSMEVPARSVERREGLERLVLATPVGV